MSPASRDAARGAATAQDAAALDPTPPDGVALRPAAREAATGAGTARGALPLGATAREAVCAFWTRPAAGPRIIGHRGAKGDAPENTLGAFARGIELGATAIELDVRTCATGEIVVMHDPTLERITGGRDARRVADLPWRELARVRLGGGERVPLLREVLSMAAARGIGVNVEMKHDVPDRAAVVRATAAALYAGGAGRATAAAPVVVSCFHPRMVMAFADVAPEVARALLVHRSNYHPLMLALVGAADGRAARPIAVDAVHIERTIATPRAVRALQARGLRVSVWTVNDGAEAERLADLGVDGLITDVPGELARRLG